MYKPPPTEKPPTADNSLTLLQCILECTGVFALCYFGGLAVIQSDMGYANLLTVAIEHGLVIAFFIHASFKITGGHLNPAVTQGLFISGHAGWKKMLGYWASQLIGSLIAGAFLQLYVSQMGYKTPLPSRLGYPHANLIINKTGICFIMEAIGTYFLLFIIYMNAVNRTKTMYIHGTAIGAYITICILAIGPNTGCAINPCRILGPAIISGELFEYDYRYAYIYYIGDFVGGALMGFTWRCLFTCPYDQETEDEFQKNAVMARNEDAYKNGFVQVPKEKLYIDNDYKHILIAENKINIAELKEETVPKRNDVKRLSYYHEYDKIDRYHP